MDEADWNDMLENATAEEYYQCDVEVNGTTFYRVAIRPKGNTSLTSIASDPTTDRYSFKLEFDHYVDGQSCFGLDKLILNNNYADATNMKEALIYDMYQYLGADASLYNYAKITVNGEYWGVYLALEAVEDSFMLRNYGAQSGKLYKPDSMNIGGGKDFGDFNADDMDFGNMTPPDTQGNTDQANSSVPSQTPDTVDPPQNRDSSGETSAEPSTDSGERPSMDFNFAGGKGGFVQLLEAVHEVEGIRRIRFVSPHPIGFRQDLVQAFTYLPKLCSHIHFPMQSGSDRILKMMRRPYRNETYLDLCSQMKQARPDLSITTDIIVGFPGETEEDYLLTRQAVEQVQFDNAFIFRYSPRRGTPAAVMENQIPEEVKEARNQDLLAVVNEIAIRKNRDLVGTVQEVLLEGPSKTNAARLSGRTSQNKPVMVDAAPDLAGEILPIRIEESTGFTLYGVPCPSRG